MHCYPAHTFTAQQVQLGAAGSIAVYFEQLIHALGSRQPSNNSTEKPKRLPQLPPDSPAAQAEKGGRSWGWTGLGEVLSVDVTCTGGVVC